MRVILILFNTHIFLIILYIDFLYGFMIYMIVINHSIYIKFYLPYEYELIL